MHQHSQPTWIIRAGDQQTGYHLVIDDPRDLGCVRTVRQIAHEIDALLDQIKHRTHVGVLAEFQDYHRAAIDRYRTQFFDPVHAFEFALQRFGHQCFDIFSAGPGPGHRD